jgi:hypothetical protein
MELVTNKDFESKIKYYKDEKEITKDLFFSESLKEENKSLVLQKYQILYNEEMYTLTNYCLDGVFKSYSFKHPDFPEPLRIFYSIYKETFSYISEFDNEYIYCRENLLHKRKYFNDTNENNYIGNILLNFNNSNKVYDHEIKVSKKKGNFLKVYLKKYKITFKENSKEYIIQPYNEYDGKINDYVGFEEICRINSFKIPLFWKKNYLVIMKKFEDINKPELLERNLFKKIIEYI